MADDRIRALLSERQVHCTLRKQPKALTDFFYMRLREYAVLGEIQGEEAQLLRPRLFTFLKFIGKPNDVWRKEALIRDQWPLLEPEIRQYVPAP